MSDLDTGKERLENWAAWAKADDPRLDFPNCAPYAKHYQAEAGDVWDGEPMEYPVDTLDACDVEDLVVSLPQEVNRSVRGFYLYRMSLGRLAKYDSTTTEEIRRRLDWAANDIGRLR